MLSNTRWCSRQLGDDNASTAKTIKSPALMAAPNLQPTPANRVSENARTSSALSVLPSGRGNDDSTGGTYGDSSQMVVGWVSAELPTPANGRGSLGDAESWLKPSGSPALAHPPPLALTPEASSEVVGPTPHGTMAAALWGPQLRITRRFISARCQRAEQTLHVSIRSAETSGK